jgi:septal ring factor EnvC (AmiA/AmiB activator)
MNIFIIFLTISATVESPEERLEILRVRLKEQKEKIAKLKGEETGILKNIQELDKEISLNRELIAELNRKIEITTEEIKNIELLMEEIDYRLKEKRNILKKRIKEIYIHGPLHPIAVVLLSYSFSDALKRIKYLSIIADQDRRVLKDVMQLESRLKLKKSQIENNLSLLETIYEEVEKQEGELNIDKEEKREYLTKVESERLKAIKMSEEMKQAMDDLEDLIRTLSSEEQTEGSSYFEKRILKLPVEGFIISYYGRKKDERYGTETLNKGIDIRAPWGNDIKSVAPGRVVYSDNFLGYGKMVLINHGGGYISLYSHLSTITVENGDVVGKDFVIGKVGQTGSAKEPFLHFEIRKAGKSVNPLNYIKI